MAVEMAAGDALNISAIPPAAGAKATESRAPSLSSRELLDAMVAGTQRLDGILDGLCASSQRETLLDEDKSTVASGSVGINSVVGRAESVEVLTTMLHASIGCQRRYDIALEDVRALDSELVCEDEDQPSWWRQFTQRTSLSLPTGAMSTASSLPPTEYSTGLLPSGLALTLVERRLRHELAACDHLLPDSTAKVLVNRALQHLHAHSELLQRGVRSVIGLESDSCSNNDDEQESQAASRAPWWTERDRQCQVSIDEGEHDGAWGLRLTLDVQSRLGSARVDDKSIDAATSEPEARVMHLVGARMRHLVFVSKRDYDKADGGSVASSCSLELSLIADETAAVEETASETPVSENQQQSGAASASPASKMLPDDLQVFVSGSVSSATSEDSSVVCWSPASAFTRLEIPSTLPRPNRIVQAACGRLHSLFVNDLGMVFACGQAMHGALGISGASSAPHSPSDLVTTPILVEFFLEKFLVVTQVACGGDELTGAHSAAVTTSGEVYTWGSGVALGSRSLRNAFKPQRVRFPVGDHGGSDEDGSSGDVKIQSVACGCGFAMAIAKDNGTAFAWGKWSEGRLGLGRIPVIERASRRHGGRKQLQAFQLSPRRLTLPVQSDASKPVTSKGESKPPAFVKIACGDAHCVAITTDGEIVSWGRGGSGQLGVGALSDSLSPAAVAVEGDRWRDVSAGSDWSMALDDDGRVWSWGGCGSGALGLGVADSTRRRLATQTLLERHEELANRQRHREAEEMNTDRSKQPETSGSDPVPRLSWMIPHLIPAFAGGDVAIVSISAGVRHGAALSRSGTLFVWGDDGNSNKLDGSVGASSPQVVDVRGHNMDAPSVAEAVECGGRQVVVVASSGGSLACDLGSLFQRCMRMSEQGESKAVADGWASPDVALLVSGRRLLAHKVLLARRSPALRRLLLDQLATFDASSTSSISPRVPEVLVPSLRLDVARVVLEYIYTDAVSLPCQLLSVLQEQQQERRSSAHVAIYLARDVLRAATELELPGLARICRERLVPALSSAPAPRGARDGDDHDGGDEEALKLGESLRAAHGDSTWSDVTLVAEGREFSAHRCVLMARSEFFRQQLRGDRQHSGVVVVEDSPKCLKRVLDFIYSDQVGASPPNTTDVYRSEDDGELQRVLEDLAVAHRYGLERLKRVCERRVSVTAGNCWAVLAAAELAQASQLKLAALAFAQRHLPTVVLGSGLDGGDEGFERFRRAHPAVVAELFGRLQAAEREDRLMTDWKASVEQRAQDEQREEARARQERQAEARFPWLALTLATTFGALFLALVQSPALRFHPAVPALNLLALALLAAAVVLGWLERI